MWGQLSTCARTVTNVAVLALLQDKDELGRKFLRKRIYKNLETLISDQAEGP